MRARAAFLLLVGALALISCDAGSALGNDYPPYRYRLTLEVETPEGLRTGSSVIEVDTSVAGDYAIPNPGRVSHRLRGEATAVDLPGNRTLFALLRSKDSVDWATNIMFMFAPDPSPEAEDRFAARFANMLAMEREVELPATLDEVNRNLRGMSARPMLVTFMDESDPTSVELVDPDDLAATFGEGYALERITVQMTDEPVTTGIDERLAWMNAYRDKWFDGSSTVSQDLTTNNLTARLSAGSFSTDYAR